MRAQILSIGSELLAGHLTDTNSTYLEQQLAALDIEVALVTHVGDDRTRIASVIQRALTDVDIVICTGGVGPTEDDLTREAICDVVGEQPAVDEQLLEDIRQFFAARGLQMPERNAKQAWLIPSAEPLENPVGTAPGWFVRVGQHVIVAMPGVPREMFRMWAEGVIPRLNELARGHVARSITLKTIGIGESLVEERLHDLVERALPVVATYAKDDGVHIRVTAVARTAAEADVLRDETVGVIRSRIGDHIYGADSETLPEVVLRHLQERGVTLAVGEGTSGGRLVSLLTGHPSSLGTLLGALVEPGAIHTAEELAHRAEDAYLADIGLGLTARLEETGPQVFSGEVQVAISGPAPLSRAMPIRAAYEDAQRRCALFAAECLLSALREPTL